VLSSPIDNVIIRLTGHNPPVLRDYPDGVVRDHVTALLADPQMIRVELDRRLQQLRATGPLHRAENFPGARASTHRTRIQRLVETYQEDLITRVELRRRMPDLRKKATALRAQLEALEAQAVDRETSIA